MQVIGAFGEPIKCYGTTTRRGRRQHVRWGFSYFTPSSTSVQQWKRLLVLIFKNLQCFVYVLSVYFNFRHMEYVRHGLKHMQLEFYIEGSEPGLKGTVHVESKEVGVFNSFQCFNDIIGTRGKDLIQILTCGSIFFLES